MSISVFEALGWGALGAVGGYVILFRTSRLADVVSHFRDNYRMLIYDLITYIVAGGFAAVLFQPANEWQAMVLGAFWEAAAAVFAGIPEMHGKYAKKTDKEVGNGNTQTQIRQNR